MVPIAPRGDATLSVGKRPMAGSAAGACRECLLGELLRCRDFDISDGMVAGTEMKPIAGFSETSVEVLARPSYATTQIVLLTRNY